MHIYFIKAARIIFSSPTSSSVRVISLYVNMYVGIDIDTIYMCVDMYIYKCVYYLNLNSNSSRRK